MSILLNHTFQGYIRFSKPHIPTLDLSNTSLRKLYLRLMFHKGMLEGQSKLYIMTDYCIKKVALCMMSPPKLSAICWSSYKTPVLSNIYRTACYDLTKAEPIAVGKTHLKGYCSVLCHSYTLNGIYIVVCQAHPGLVKIGPVLAPSFYF